MGLFREDTEEEKAKKSLIKAIRNSNLTYNWVDTLVAYVSAVYDKERSNDFLEYEYLDRIILEIILNSNYVNELDADSELDKIIDYVRMILPCGNRTDMAQEIISTFVNQFKYDENGFVNARIFKEGFYNLFDNKVNALKMLYLGYKNGLSEEDLDVITKYSIEIAPYCNNQDILFYEINAFINGFKVLEGDIESYYKDKLDEIKKRVGIYPLDEKSLALISAEASKAQKLIAKLDALQRKIDGHQDRVKAITAAGKKEIKEAILLGLKDIEGLSNSSCQNIENSIEEYVKEITKKLDDYLITLEKQMKNNSDQVFGEILFQTKKKIEEIKFMANEISSTTTGELLRIQKATADSVDSLKAYVADEPRLQELLKGAKESDEIRTALLQFSSITTGSKGSNNPLQQVVVPGYDQAIVPAGLNVVIPNEKITIRKEGEKAPLIASFDTLTSFKKRFKRIEDTKALLEEKGEIFHEKTLEIIKVIMEGGWPYLWGPSGCGKSYTIKQVAELLGLDLIENGKITDKYSIMAYSDPHGRFRATQAFVAFTYGKLLFLDEFDNGNTDTQVVLNSLYSALLDALQKPEKLRYATFAENMTVPVNLNFRMISAGNTSGSGENQAYSSRGKIDESVLERMTPIFFNYDNRIEQVILSNAKGWFDFFINFRKACDAYAIKEGMDAAPGMATTRDATAIAISIENDVKTVDEILRHNFIQTKTEEYLNYLKKYMSNVYDIESDLDTKNCPLNEYSGEALAKKFILESQKTIEMGRRI